MTNELVKPLSETSSEWLGGKNLPPDHNIGLFIDSGLLLIFGGIPWQVSYELHLTEKLKNF